MNRFFLLVTLILLLFSNNSNSQIQSGVSAYVTPLVDTTFTITPRKIYDNNFDSICFGSEESVSGIYTFRGNNQRNSPVLGTIAGIPSKITFDWFFNTGVDTVKGKYGIWAGGAGWTGQPLYVEWTSEEVNNLDGVFLKYKKRNTGLHEIIQVSLCGKVYFIEAETGSPTRKALEINNPVKGTPSIDGINRKYLLVGQGIKNRDIFAWRIFDLRKHTLLHVQPMPSPFAPKGWGACDASPLIEHTTGIFIWPTESGVIYRGTLDKIKSNPAEQFKYSIIKHPRQGIESSPSAYRNLGYLTDNAGNVFCADLRNMKPRWHFFNTDDSDASPVLNIENGIPYIFIGNEVDQQGPVGKAYLRKLNGLTGKPEWEYERDCYSVTEPKTNNGGMLTTVLIGKKRAEGSMWTIFSRTDSIGRGSFLCLNVANGKVKYEIPLSSYSWASPIALYDTDGFAYIYFSDVAGKIYLIDGSTGEIIYKESTGNVFESSPIAIGNRIIQPARGNKIFSLIVD
jgi:hypothetical protein